MGGMCLGSLCCRASCRSAGIRSGSMPVSSGHRRHGSRPAVRHAARRRRLHSLGRRRGQRHPVARRCCQRVPAAADPADGRHPAGDALDRNRRRASRARFLLAATSPGLWSAVCLRASTCSGARHGRRDLRGCGVESALPSSRWWLRRERRIGRPHPSHASGARARSLGRVLALALVRDDGAGGEVLWTRTLSLLFVPRPIRSR